MKKIKNKKAITFLLFKIPFCILMVIIFFELISYLIKDYRAIRHGLDRKVAKIESLNYIHSLDFILFGDSVTKDIADRYNLIPQNLKALNLTTNKASGLIGSYLLYKKLLEKSEPPNKLIISSTPGFLTYFPQNQTKELYLNSVFNSKKDKNEINKYYSSKKQKVSYYKILTKFKNKYKLTIFNINEKIIYPIINFLGFININDAITFGKIEVPNIELLKSLESNKKIINYEFYESSIDITKEFELLINNFFKLLNSNKTEIYIIWAPLRSNYYESLLKTGDLKILENFLKEKAKTYNLKLNIFDISDAYPFPPIAFRDVDHLKQGYWKAYYSYILKKHLSTTHY